MATVLVTDGEQRSALAVARSLGRAGHTVLVGRRQRAAIAAASRHAAHAIDLPDPLAEAEAFARGADRVASRVPLDLVVPVTDASTLALLRHGSETLRKLMPCGDLESFCALSDKVGVAATARTLGIDVPEQVVLELPGDAPGSLGPPPYVVKPGRSVSLGDGPARSFSVRHAASAAELREELAMLPPEAFPVLVQRRIVGPGVGVFLLVWDGELRAQFGHRRIREKPPWGGVSVLAESLVPPAELVQKSLALLAHHRWRSVAMVEFKRDAATGRHYLMEVNARFWGTLQLAIDAGVDFPTLLLAAATGRPVGPIPEYRPGVRSRWWWGDVDQLLISLRRPGANAPPGASRSRLASAVRFARAGFPLWRDQVFRFGDPGPFLVETANWIRRR